MNHNKSSMQHQINGVGLLYDVTLEGPFTINGSGRLTNVKTVDEVIVNGTAQLVSSEFGALIVNGSIYLENSTAHDACVNGVMRVVSCTIGHIKVDGACTLNNSLVASIELEKRGWWFFSYIAKIKLIDTCVEGDIVFNGGKGRVLLYGNSTIKGNVIGGVIKRT